MIPQHHPEKHNGLSWTAQYIYDHASRIHRGPDKTEYDKMGTPTARLARPAQSGSTLHHFLSDLNWQINPDWSLQWLAVSPADQNFDHYYGGTCNESTRLLSQTYAWQPPATKPFPAHSPSTVNSTPAQSIIKSPPAGISAKKAPPVLAVFAIKTSIHSTPPIGSV